MTEDSGGMDRTKMDRRKFVQMAGVACLAGAVSPAMAEPAPATHPSAKAKNPMGTVVWIEDGQSIDTSIRTVRGLGFSV